MMIFLFRLGIESKKEENLADWYGQVSENIIEDRG